MEQMLGGFVNVKGSDEAPGIPARIFHQTGPTPGERRRKGDEEHGQALLMLRQLRGHEGRVMRVPNPTVIRVEDEHGAVEIALALHVPEETEIRPVGALNGVDFPV